MPRLDRPSTNESGSGMRGKYNPNTIIPWNCVRMESESFAVLNMMLPMDNSPIIDVAQYHSHRSITDGKQQFRYVYCSTKNVYTDDDGRQRQITPGECDLCKSQDEDTKTTRPRFNLWAFCYAIYHANQNPRAGRYDDAEEWDQRRVGNRHYYQEKVMKPQILQAPQTVINIFRGYEERLGAEKFVSSNFDLAKRGIAPAVQYTGYESQVQLPSITDDIRGIVESLPDIEKVSAELITEWEFPQLMPDSGDAESGKAKDAFEAAGGEF